jgi:hypothetical protein
MDTLLYVAPPGQVKFGIDDDPLVNTEPAHVLIRGHAIPGHVDGHGHPFTAGFDVVSLSLATPVEFRSAQAIVEAPVGHQLHWRQVPQALQWADEQVRYPTPSPLFDNWVQL